MQYINGDWQGHYKLKYKVMWVYVKIVFRSGLEMQYNYSLGMI